MSLIPFNSSDFVTTKLNTANTQFTISSSAVAAASSIWAFVCNSTTGGYIPKPDTTALSSSNVSISSAFRHIANYFFGTSTYIPDAYAPATQRTTVRVIQIGRPTLDEGIYPGTISAAISSNIGSFVAIDTPNYDSESGPYGLTGTLTNGYVAAEQVGTVFYDHGVIVLHGGYAGASYWGDMLTNPNYGFAISGGGATDLVSLTSFKCQTRNIVKRAVYFCRAFNRDFNYTTNPTARGTDGKLISSLTANPTTFITTIGLYDDSGRLLAVAKVNPAKRKDAYTEATFKVQLDF